MAPHRVTSARATRRWRAPWPSRWNRACAQRNGVSLRVRIGGAWLMAAALVLLLPTTVYGVTAPTLQSPASGVNSFIVGASMTFQWQGVLQGDPDTLARSSFRLEIAKAGSVPAGTQADWTAIVNSSLTSTPGEQTNSIAMGVPEAGNYRWRVCALGVVDDTIDNTIQQLPDGCSTVRAFGSAAAASKDSSIGRLDQKQTVRVDGETKVIEAVRPGDSEPVEEEPLPALPQPKAAKQPVAFQDVAPRGRAEGSALAITEPATDFTADREGLSGSVMSGLNATLPGVPIPFWTLAFLLACLPIASQWRRSVLGMFEWSDGRDDVDDGEDLLLVPDAQEIKDRTIATDGEDAGPGSTSNRRRPAA